MSISRAKGLMCQWTINTQATLWTRMQKHWNYFISYRLEDLYRCLITTKVDYELVIPGELSSRAPRCRGDWIFMVAPNVWGLAYVTLRASRILSWLLDFSKNCVPPVCMTVLLDAVICMEYKGFNVLVFNSLTLLMLLKDTLCYRINLLQCFGYPTFSSWFCASKVFKWMCFGFRGPMRDQISSQPLENVSQVCCYDTNYMTLRQ